MIREEMKVGPKGQVVIPAAIRKALKITPGSKVQITLEEGKAVLEKPAFDAVAVFKRVANSIQCNEPIDPHAAYDEELEERTRRALSGR